jgi:hypothetical protein
MQRVVVDSFRFPITIIINPVGRAQVVVQTSSKLSCLQGVVLWIFPFNNLWWKNSDFRITLRQSNVGNPPFMDLICLLKLPFPGQQIIPYPNILFCNQNVGNFPLPFLGNFPLPCLIARGFLLQIQQTILRMLVIRPPTSTGNSTVAQLSSSDPRQVDSKSLWGCSKSSSKSFNWI